jgi:hypothetical protein
LQEIFRIFALEFSTDMSSGLIHMEEAELHLKPGHEKAQGLLDGLYPAFLTNKDNIIFKIGHMFEL